MAVNRSESGRADTIRKLQDEYYAKETQNNKKHKTELRHLTEDYQRSVEDLKNDHKQQVEQLNGYMTSRLSKQEQEHQRQVAEVRDIYSTQIRKKAEESNRLYDAQGDAYESEIDKQKQVTNNQRERLAKEFQLQLEKKDQAITNYTKFSKEENDKLWSERREKMEKTLDDSLDSQRKGLNEQISNLHRQIGEVKKNNASESRRVETQNVFEKERLKNNFGQAMARQEEINRTNHEAKARDFQLVQNLSKEKFNKALADKQEKLDDAHEEFKRDISERINSRVSGLKNELIDVKSQKVLDHTNLFRQNQNEKKHLISDYEDKLRSERQQREGAVKMANTEIEGEVTKATKARDRMIKSLSDAHAREKDLTKTKNFSQVSQLRNDMEERELHITGRAESRVTRANENLRQSEKRMQKFYEMNLDLIKGDYITELNNERMRHIQERADLENRLGTKIREQEKEMTHALEARVLSYEEKIRSMKDFYENEMRKQAAQNSKLLNERETYYKTVMKSHEMRNENQINQIKETHNSEVETNERRHREELNSLAQKISEKSRKQG
jgi:hypothetical protein